MSFETVCVLQFSDASPRSIHHHALPPYLKKGLRRAHRNGSEHNAMRAEQHKSAQIAIKDGTVCILSLLPTKMGYTTLSTVPQATRITAPDYSRSQQDIGKYPVGPGLPFSHCALKFLPPPAPR